MKKNIFILLCLFVYILSTFSGNKISGIYTTLIILEERENENFILENSSIIDGIFEALWNKNEYIFFDMMIDKPLSIVQDKLDIEPFLLAARESGADSILLIKFHYSSKEEKAGLRIKADGVFFNLYSLNHLKSIREGEIKVKVNEYIEISKKVETLKKIGFNVLNKIYK